MSTAKTFTARSAVSSDGTEGASVFIQGKFYDFDTTKTFKKINCVCLVETMPSKETQKAYGPEFLFIKRDADSIAVAQAHVDAYDPQTAHQEFILIGRGRNITSILLSTSPVA